MASVNKVILLGNLGKDPEIRVFDNGRKVARVTLATNEYYTDKNTNQKVEKTEWHNVNFWGNLADIVHKYLKKGSTIYLEGKLTTRSYEQDGIKKYSTEIEGQTMQMIRTERNNSESSNQNYSNSSSTTYSSQQTTGNNTNPEVTTTVEDSEDDLPF